MDKLELKQDALMHFYRDMATGCISHQPGVKSVSFARLVPLSGYQWDESFKTLREQNTTFT